MTTPNKRKVLIIDDDQVLPPVLVEKFVEAGFEADRASDGEEGLRKAFESHPDIILLDLVMPKLSGLEMLEKLRADSWGKDAKVVVLTGLEQKIDYMAKAVEGNILGYLVKTNYSFEEIVQKVKDILDKLPTSH